MERASDQRIHVLEIQNKRLSEKVETQKADLTNRQHTIDRQAARWSEAQTAVLAVRRGWTQLHEDIHDFAQRLGLDANPGPSDAPFFDPLVVALLKPANEHTPPELDAVTQETAATAALTDETEQEVKRQSASTTQLLAQLHEQLRSETRSDVGEETVDGLKALHRAAQERARVAEDKLTRSQTELSETRNQLMDAQIDLETAQRKISMLKSKVIDKGTPPPQPQAPAVTSNEAEPRGSDDAASAKAVQKLCIDSLIQSKIEELEKERREHFKTQKELHSFQLNLKSESWIQETRQYRALAEQKSDLIIEVEKLRNEVGQLKGGVANRAATGSKKRKHDPETRVQSFVSLKETQKKLQELQTRIMKGDVTDQKLEGSQKGVTTTEEFKSLLGRSEDENRRLKARLKDSVGDEERVEAARKEAIESGKLLRTSESRLERLEETLKELETHKKQMTQREAQLMETKEDLKVFVDVLATCDVVDRQWKEAEARARERNALRQNATLKRKIEEMESVHGDEDLKKEMELSKKRLKRLKEKLEQLEVEMEGMKRTNQHQRDDLEQQKQLNSYLQEELEQAGTAYEETQAQSTRLLTEMSERDTLILQLRSQIAKLSHRVEVLTSLVENLENKVKWDGDDVTALKEIREAFEGRVEELTQEKTQLKGEVGQLEEKLKFAKAEIVKHEIEIGEIQKRLEMSDATAEEQKRATEAEMDRHLQERSKRQKMEADVKAFEDLKRKLRSGNLTKADFDRDQDVALLNREVESMRRCLNCSVCGARSKSVILLKCMHTFCKPCIDNRIETRSRRCPGCGSAFSREEVRPFFLN